MTAELDIEVYKAFAAKRIEGQRAKYSKPVVMKIALPTRDQHGDHVKVQLGARVPSHALEELRRWVKRVHVTGSNHRLYIDSWSWAHDRTEALEILLNANSNALTPGGWSWELRERVRDREGNISTRVQLFEAPPADANRNCYARVGWQPVLF